MAAPNGRRAKPVFRADDIALTRGQSLAAFTGIAPAARGEQIVEVPLDALWLEHQPREIVPEEQLQRLIAEDRARPADLLQALEWAASADGYYAGVLDAIRDLASSIADQGVLQPIEVVTKAGRYIVRDGHRRSLAALLAGRTSVPVRAIDEPNEEAGFARAFVVNLQRQDLTPLEKAAALLRLAMLVGRRLAEEQGLDPTAVTVNALVGDEDTESATADSMPAEGQASDGRESAAADSKRGWAVRSATGLPRGLTAKVRERVCALTGLKRAYYYQLLALNRLSPEARPLARGLAEGRLRPVVGLPRERQAEVLAFAEARNLDTKALTSLCQVVRRGDEDEVQRLMARLRREQSRPRATPSWYALLYAVPADFAPRLAALEAELAALPEPARAARLDEVRQQVNRMAGALEGLQGILTHAAPRADTDDGRHRPLAPPH